MHCIRPACGLQENTLWANSALTEARRRYEHEGYGLVEEFPHRSFGKDLTGQTWELTLQVLLVALSATS